MSEIQRRFGSLFEALPTPVVVLDSEAETVEDVNAAFEAETGFLRTETLGRTLLDLGLWTDRVQPEQLRNAIRRDGKVTEFEASLNTKSGDLFIGRISTELFRDEDRSLIVMVVIDITARRRAETVLVDALGVAEKASRAKGDFVSRMSHELRTPLNVILGFAQVLQLDDLAPQQADAVGHVIDSAKNLLATINDILDLSRVDAGRVQYTITEVPVTETIEEALSVIQPMADDAEIQLRFVRRDTPLVVMADRQLLKQVLLNLLSNAIKYNIYHGAVVISATVAPNGTVRIDVTDTGLGIDPTRAAMLFQPFERLGAEASSIEGTGLGLSLSKRFIEGMGGTIGWDGSGTEGSRFWIRLPAVPRDDAAPTERA